MIIRTAREEDYDDLARVWFEGYRASAPRGTEIPQGLRENMRTRIASEIVRGAWDVYAADNNSEIVAILALEPNDSSLREIFAADGARSRGVGRALMDFTKSKLRDGFWLRTHVTNTNAHRFYEREGMRHTHTAPHPNHPEAMFRHYSWP
jgi:GNAT superfamily N-acetyltransferase